MFQFLAMTPAGCRRSFLRHLLHRITTLAILAVAALVTQVSYTQPVTADQASRPNIVLIMADDMGFSDLGCYGSEIDTPHLDALATGGLRFTQFYNTAKCHSSRVSLLTGQYCIAAGDTSLSHAVTTAEILGSSGYFTAMTGKWHLTQEHSTGNSRRTVAASVDR
jgi:arylsulfatase